MNEKRVIKTQALTKTYRQGTQEVHALQGIDLTVHAGELVAIMGPSGSGKSTLMNILGCLDSPTSGQYLLDGQAVNGLGSDKLAQVRNQRIGFVFQGFNLLPRTSALNNVELPLLYDRRDMDLDTRARARASLERMGLGDRLHHDPNQRKGFYPKARQNRMMKATPDRLRIKPVERSRDSA